jgi:1-acyl-sn-glycerol-3-phosphate acyltransferase
MLSKFILYFKLILAVVLSILNIIFFKILPEIYSHNFFVRIVTIMINVLNLKINLHGNADNLKKNKLLVMCNHYDGMDFLIISKIFGYNKLHTIVKDDLVGSSYHKNFVSDLFYYFKNAFYNSGCFIPYKRGDKDDGAIIKKIIVEKIENNNNILIFPEGRARTNGIPEDFKYGIFKLAVENKFNILPISIKYDKDAGSEMNEPVNLFKWIGLSANVYVHDIVSSENKDILQLKDEVFKIITSVLIDKVDNAEKV